MAGQLRTILVTLLLTAVAFSDPPKPVSIAAAPNGSVWYADAGRRVIAHLLPAGTVVEYRVPVTGFALSRVFVARDGTVWFAQGNTFGTLGRNGGVTVHSLRGLTVSGMCDGPDGSVWMTAIGSAGNDYHGAILDVARAGRVSTFTIARTLEPRAITLAPDGSLWFTETVYDAWAGRIAKIAPDGRITTVRELRERPAGIAIGSDRHVWFTTSDRIGRLTGDRDIAWYQWPSHEFQPGDQLVSRDGKKLWLTAGSVQNRVLANIDMTGRVSLVAGAEPYWHGVAAGADGGVYFASEHSISRVMPNGQIAYYQLPGGPAQPNFWDRLGRFWNQWGFAIIALGLLILPNLDSVLCLFAVFALMRLTATHRERLIERMPLQSIALASLIASTTIVTAALLAALSAAALQAHLDVQGVLVSLTGIYGMACAALVIAAIHVRGEAAKTRRVVAALGVISGLGAAGQLGVSINFLRTVDSFGLFCGEIAALLLIVFCMLVIARPRKAPIGHFTDAVIVSAGILNGALGAVALTAASVTLALTQSSPDLDAEESMFLLMPIAMIVLCIRGIAAASTAVALGNRLRAERRVSVPAA